MQHQIFFEFCHFPRQLKTFFFTYNIFSGFIIRLRYIACLHQTLTSSTLQVKICLGVKNICLRLVGVIFTMKWRVFHDCFQTFYFNKSIMIRTLEQGDIIDVFSFMLFLWCMAYMAMGYIRIYMIVADLFICCFITILTCNENSNL